MSPEMTGGRGTGRSVRRIVTTRRGGASVSPYDSFNLGAAVGDAPAAVAANRARLAAAAGLPVSSLVWMQQVHGAAVTHVHAPVTAPVAGSDGVVTTTPALGLAVLAADCVPMLAADQQAGVIAAVHAGRRGAASGIALRAVEAMVALGATARDIDVLLGPAICGACYEVPTDMRDEVEAVLPGSASRTSQGSPGLDLRAGIGRQLRAAGVDRVVADPRCTYTDPELFSHRRGAPTGRIAGLIWMPS